MKSLKDRVQHEEKYITFLEKRLASQNFRQNVSSEEFDATREKLKKAKFILKTLRS